jgi:hypothetical protein
MRLFWKVFHFVITIVLVVLLRIICNIIESNIIILGFISLEIILKKETYLFILR